MGAEILERFEAIEECYEFMLAYAAQGLSSDRGSESGRQVREFLNRAAEALGGLEESCAAAMRESGTGPERTPSVPETGIGPAATGSVVPFLKSLEEGARLPAFLAVLDRDARDSLAAVELVLAQPAISSQLIDNLNASMHLRALLTDVFLLGEVLRGQRKAALA
jgi:hypothetical protein